MSNSKPKDSGLRGTRAGRIYIDKKVFFKRADVQRAIKTLKNSEVVKRQLQRAAG